MFTKAKLKSDSQLSPSEVANLLIDDALTKMSLLTGLDSQKCMALLSAQVTKEHLKPTELTNTNAVIQSPVLEQGELQFINQLFH